MRLLPFFLASPMILLAACSTTTHAISPDKAKWVPASQVMTPEMTVAGAERDTPVTFVRDRGYVGSRMGTVAMVDGVPVALLKSRQKVTAWVTPGQHVFAMGYAKHLESRPLARQAFFVDSRAGNVFRLKLALGADPVFIDTREATPSTAPARSLGIGTEYVLPTCAAGQAPVGQCAGHTTRLTATGFCAEQCRGTVQAKPRATWYDLGNLEDYLDPTLVSSTVDEAISKASTKNWALGNVGRHMDPKHRYIFTKKAGWIDLKHIISTASNPGAYVPGASWLMSWIVEVCQVYVAPMSAFLEEDMVSNRIGANAALKYGTHLGGRTTRGQLIAQSIERLEPMHRIEAMEYFGIATDSAAASVP